MTIVNWFDGAVWKDFHLCWYWCIGGRTY